MIRTIQRSLYRVAAALAVSAGLVAGAQAQTYQLTMCGASPGGLWSLLGAGVDAALKASYPGSSVTYQTSGGGFANVALLAQNKCDMALIHDAEAIAAVTGKPPFKAPMTHLRTVAVLYTWAPMQLIVSKAFAEEHGVKSLSDIVAKKAPMRLLLNRRGNVASQVGEAILEAAGADLDAWGGGVTYAASKEQGELMRDRRADAMLNSLFVGHGSIRQLAGAIDLVLLPIDTQIADKVVAQWKIAPFTIPGGAYEWAPQATTTLTLAAQLFVNADADPKMVGDLVRAMIQNQDKIAGVHKAMNPLDAKLMSSGVAVAYHPAAEAAFAAAGLR